MPINLLQKKKMKKHTTLLLVLGGFFLFGNLAAQKASHDQMIITDSETARVEFIKKDKWMESLFSNSFGYVIFPNVGKGGGGIGGASGNGAVYEKGNLVGMASLKQVTVGLQAGGQAFREVIFFENSAVMEKFRNSQIKLSSEVSAIALDKGTAANVKFTDGMVVFVQPKAGLMYELSVGGQAFTFRPVAKK
jgi:lipid-binding SYLF domain-containing protein